MCRSGHDYARVLLSGGEGDGQVDEDGLGFDGSVAVSYFFFLSHKQPDTHTSLSFFLSSEAYRI